MFTLVGKYFEISPVYVDFGFDCKFNVLKINELIDEPAVWPGVMLNESLGILKSHAV